MYQSGIDERHSGMADAGPPGSRDRESGPVRFPVLWSLHRALRADPVPPTSTPHPTRSPLPGLALAAILLLALGLRLWGIRYGLPWLFYFHDEPQVVLRALRFGTGDLNPHFFIWPATLLLYAAFASFGGLFVFGRLAGWWSGREGFAAAYFQDPSPFYLLPRLQSVAMGVWGVWLAARLGQAAYTAPVGVAAAAGLTLNALHSHYSHFAHPVTWMASFTLLGLWAAIRIAHDGGTRDLVVGAAALGLGVASQYHAGLLVVPLGVAVLIRAITDPERRSWWLLRGAAMIGGGIALWLMISPYTLIDFRSFRSDLAWITAKTEGSLTGTSQGGWAGLETFVRVCLLPALGGPIAIAGAAGMLFALIRRTRADLVLLAFTIAYIAVASRAASLNDRYATPLVVPALLFAARLIELLVLEGWSRARTMIVVPVTTAVLCVPVAARLVEDGLTMTRDDTRVEALRWFEANVPPDSRVVLDMLKFWNTATAPVAENRARLEERLAQVQTVQGGGHSAAYTEFYRYRLAHPHQPAYYLRSTEMGMAVPALDTLLAQGFEWAMVSSQVTDGMIGRAAPADSSGAAFYRALEASGPPVAEFHPEPWARRGPTIRIYRLRPTP